MKKKLFITTMASMLFFSCTADNMMEDQSESRTREYARTDAEKLKSTPMLNLEEGEGDPVNPKPPRK